MSNCNTSSHQDQNCLEVNHGSGRVLILSDSHGSDLHSLAESSIKQKVTAVVRPGAPLAKVVQGIKKFTDDFTKRDTVIVIGGTDDLERCGAGITLASVSFLLNSTKKKTNLIMATIPSGHDKPEMYDKVNYLNDRIKEQRDSFEYCTRLNILLYYLWMSNQDTTLQLMAFTLAKRV